MHILPYETILFFIVLFRYSRTFSCNKESFITSSEASLSASQDSLYFDTLFTSTGSVTQYFKIYNENDRKLRISSIVLSGGNSSFFKINADGFTGPEVRDLEMAANDSMYVFVTVKIDPTTSNLPYIIEDNIRIRFNDNERTIKLSAWGQNANFLNTVAITGNETFTNEKPYVILGGLLVAENAVLTIEKGTKIYLHADAPILVDGTLNAVGEKYDSTRIVFAGDRLDLFYRDYPGAWPGIYFRQNSRDNLLKNIIIKNAYQGIVTEKPSVNANPKLRLEECIIDNCYDAGIIGLQSDINAVNCLISNCGKNILLFQGGKYNFKHCTNVAISNSFIQHKEPVLTTTNFIKQGNNVTVSDLSASFTNCIFWGDNGTVDDEVVVLKEGNSLFDVDFKNCIWKVNTEPEGLPLQGLFLTRIRYLKQ